MEGEKLNIDSIIQRLLDVRGSRPGKNVQLTEGEIRGLCLKSREIFLSQPSLLELEAPLKICGDIHGQYYDLLKLFEYGGYPPEANYLFLGNYVDYGKHSLETMCLLLAYKIIYPENFFLLRGNHECASINRIFGFYDECRRRYNIRLWKTFIDCFNCLPVAAIIDEKVFCCHGGLSPDLQSMEQIRRIMRPTDVPDQGLLCDLLWADPDKETMGWGENDRGISFTFGPEITSKFLAKHDFDLIARSNQVIENGYEFFAKRQVVTLFSAPNFMGEYDNAGAMMSVDETLTCKFLILKPADSRKFGGIGGHPGPKGGSLQPKSSTTPKFVPPMIQELSPSAKDLFQEAMQKGYVVLQTTVLLLVGVAGAGKTSFCHLLFNEPPPEVRSSTPIARSSIRALSLTKAYVRTEPGLEVIVWERVTAKKLNNLIANGIKSIRTHQQLIVSTEAELRLQHSTLTPVKQLINDMKRVDISNISSRLSVKSIQEQSVIKSEDQSEITASTKVVVNNKPIKSDVDELLQMEHVKELLKIVTAAEGSGEIFKRRWIYVVDTGGQPQFHELLPTFVHHVSAAVFFIKLNELLKEYPMIEYYKNGVLCGKPYKSSCTHLQTLQNCLQAMQSRNQMSNSSQCPKLLFVGTHKDIESRVENIESKNTQLLEILLQHKVFCDNLVYHSLGKSDQLLYPVNAKEPHKEDKGVAADFRQKVMNQCQTQEYKIPIGWFVLEQLLQDLSKDGIISFDKCLEVAKYLGMDKEQLLAALEYLVKLNVFEYFSIILPNVVFTTSQVLLNKVTELVEYSHLIRETSFCSVDLSDLKFREYGIITIDMLKREKFSSHYVSGLFEAEDLLDLWVQLLVIAKGKDGDFIVPAVLPEVSLNQLSKHQLPLDSSKVIPIAIHYPGGFFPSGIFSSLVSYLQNKSGDWTISINVGKPACLFKNCVNFSVSGSITANVTLIYSHRWIEIHATTYGKNKKKLCLLRDEIFKGLKHAEEIQKYSDIIHELAFFCPSSCGNPSSVHLASPITPDNEVMQCRRDQTKYSDLTERHALWLELTNATDVKHCVCPQDVELYIIQEQIVKPGNLSTFSVSDSDVANLSTKPRLYELDRIKGNGKTVRIISRTAAVWERVATRLHFKGHEITCIKRDNHFQTVDACHAMFSKWLEGKGRTPTNWETVIKVLKEAELGEVAQDLKEVLGV